MQLPTRRVTHPTRRVTDPTAHRTTHRATHRATQSTPRRTPGMAASAAALAAFHLNGQQPTWLALAALVAYIVSFSLGLGAIPWLLMGEIFPGHVRALGSSVATMLNWTCSFVVTETFDYVRLALGPAGTFLGFCAVCVAGFVFVAACVPETKGKSLEEIQALFQR